ncbi:unnamed protein product, partial [Callosobruchus maculatus]
GSSFHFKGFTVALFYCFLNTEVQNTVKHHFETWKTRRTLGSRSLRSGSRSKDWSPRSRTESIRSKDFFARRQQHQTSPTISTAAPTNLSRSTSAKPC